MENKPNSHVQKKLILKRQGTQFDKEEYKGEREGAKFRLIEGIIERSAKYWAGFFSFGGTIRNSLKYLSRSAGGKKKNTQKYWPGF